MPDEKLTEESEFRPGGLVYDGEIDLSQALKLETGGSICDAFMVRHHRRRVFMKLLREEYRNSSLHLAALDKEFDVGVTLNHKSLPRYLEFHDNYILMDYIEGDSLHKMMLNNDPWLSSEKNLWRFLRQLLEVTDYLHKRHIVHCDIKPDNIILTWEERNVVLIDLDKCHTDWLDDTSGKQYFPNGLESPEGVKTDFESIGSIIDLWIECVPSLKNKWIIKFRNLCYKKNIKIEELNNFIDRHKSQSSVKSSINISLMAVILAAGLLTGIMLLKKSAQKKDHEEIAERTVTEILNKNTSDSIIIPMESKKEESMPIQPSFSKANSPDTDIASFTEKTFSHNIDPTMKAIAEFRKIGQDSALSKIELYSRIPDITKLYYKAFFDTRSELTEVFPDISIQKIDDAIVLCNSFQNYMKEWKETLELINKREVSKVVSDSLNHLN